MAIDWLKLVLALLQPLTVALLLGFCAVLLRAWWIRGLALLALAALYALSTPHVAALVAGNLEQRYAQQAATELPERQAIVLLGGGVAAGASHQQRDLTAAADRMHFAAALWHAGKAPLIIATGGGSPVSEAHAMRAVLRELGVEADAIIVEPRARNTREHPGFVKPLLRDPEAPVLLVSSALHMPRAVANFRAAGVDVTPAPTDFELLLQDPVRNLLPDTQALDRSTRALREHAGLMHLRVFGMPPVRR